MTDQTHDIDAHLKYLKHEWHPDDDDYKSFVIITRLREQCEAKDAEIERLKARLFPPDCPPADQERDHLAEQCATLGRENASFSTENETLWKALESAESYLAFLDSCDEGSDEGPIVLAKVREALAARRGRRERWPGVRRR